MRILITGPECTGKSTLSAELSQTLSIPWFPEYARTYLEKNGPSYGPEDILLIAKQHAELYAVFPVDQSLIMDTYLLNLKIWSDCKYGNCAEWIQKTLENMSTFDLIFLTAPDLTWKQDGLRENPNNGEVIFQLFQNELKSLGLAYYIIRGQGSARLDSARRQVDILSV